MYLWLLLRGTFDPHAPRWCRPQQGRGCCASCWSTVPSRTSCRSGWSFSIEYEELLIRGAPLGVGYWKKRAGGARRPTSVMSRPDALGSPSPTVQQPQWVSESPFSAAVRVGSSELLGAVWDLHDNALTRGDKWRCTNGFRRYPSRQRRVRRNPSLSAHAALALRARVRVGGSHPR